MGRAVSTQRWYGVSPLHRGSEHVKKRSQEKVEAESTLGSAPSGCQADISLGFRCSQLSMHGGWDGVLSGVGRSCGPSETPLALPMRHRWLLSASRGAEEWKLLPPTAFARNFPLCGFLCHSLDKRPRAEQM